MKGEGPRDGNRAAPPVNQHTERIAEMATASKAVNILPLELETVNIKIVGTSPLIVHAWSHKAKQEMLDKQMGKAKKSKHDVKIPMNDAIESLYWLTNKPELGKDDAEAEKNFDAAVTSGAKFGFPVTGIKQSAITGAYRSGMDVKQTELRGSFYIEGSTDCSTTDLAEIVGSDPKVREDTVLVGGMSKSADIRYRGQFDEWEIPLRFTYNKNGKYTLEQLLNCFNAGGFATGIGEWRPERDGQFGMYRLELA